MKDLLVVAIVVLAGLLVVAVPLAVGAWQQRRQVAAAASSQQAISSASWEPLHVSRDNDTEVLVVRRAEGRLVEQQLLQVLACTDADYENLLHQAMASARLRAAVLNSERD